HATGATGALVGRRLGDGHHVQPGEAAVGVVARFACLAAVDHHAHAGQGHRRLGHVGGQHHAAAAIAGGLQHARLLFHRQLTMQGQYFDAGIQRFLQASLHPRDLALAGQEHQQVTGVIGQGLLHRAAHLQFQRLIAARREMADRHRVAAALAAQPRRIEEACQALAIQRGRHHYQAQVIAQLRLHVQRQRQAEVTAEMALVEFVEQDRTDLFQHRVVLQHAGQDAFGDDFNAGACRDLVLEADAVADRAADLFAQLPCHEQRGATCGDPARLQQDDFPALQPWRVEQGQWHLGGLAGARRGFQHQPWLHGQVLLDLRQQRGNREERGIHGQRIRGHGGRRYNARALFPPR
ncbi:hypothetical protein SM139_3440, partial [Stenotrophomonas maltophilia]